jgi:capsid assembly protease
VKLSTREIEGAELFPRSVWGIRQEALRTVVARAALASNMSPEQMEALAKVPTMAAVESAQPEGGSVAILPLQGVITPRGGGLLSLLLGGMPGGLTGFRTAFREAMSDNDVKAILLVVDSPGGLTDLVPETAAEVRAARDTKDVVAIAHTEACSAAYWIASQAREVVASPSAKIGSIGCFLRHEEISRMAEMEGVKITTFRNGRFKAEANPYEELTDDAEEHLQAMVDTIGTLFHQEVAAGRGIKEERVRTGYGEGRAVLAQQAVEMGMADRIATLEELIGEMTNAPKSTRPGARAEDEDPKVTVDDPELPPEPVADEDAPADRSRVADFLFN